MLPSSSSGGLKRHNLHYTTMPCDGDSRSYLALHDDKSMGISHLKKKIA